MSPRLSALLSLPLSLALVQAAHAQEADAPPQGWHGTGELGFALSRGNSRSENLNAKLAFGMEDAQWKHDWSVAALRSKGEVKGDFDGDGIEDERYEKTANRYELGASSAYKFDERSYLVGAGRYENDDFSPYDYQGTASVGYGYYFVRNERTSFSGEAGPGYRRARDAATGRIESSVIGRAELELAHKLTDNTALTDTLLVESGKDNTFAQNDFGVSVAMNEAFALKAGLQARYNSDVEPGIKKTDTLTTLNLVYNFL